MKRLPKERFYRGLMTANMITPKDIPLIQRKLADFQKYQLLNVTFTQNRGHRWANRLQSFAKWLWENREIILRILGLVIMFAEDGTPTVVDEKDLDEKTLKEVKQNLAKRKPTKLTPHGEKVHDFTTEEAMETLTNEAQEAGLYDVGLEDNPLVKKDSDESPKPKRKTKKKTSGEKNEVQPWTDSGEDVARYESDDV